MNNTRDGHHIVEDARTLLTGDIQVTCSCGWQDRAHPDAIYGLFMRHRFECLAEGQRLFRFRVALGTLLIGAITCFAISYCILYRVQLQHAYHQLQSQPQAKDYRE